MLHGIVSVRSGSERGENVLGRRSKHAVLPVANDDGALCVRRSDLCSREYDQAWNQARGLEVLTRHADEGLVLRAKARQLRGSASRKQRLRTRMAKKITPPREKKPEVSLGDWK